MTILRQRPQASGITVRQPQFNAQHISRYYYGRSPILTHLLNALSATFPMGEQFFVHSVRHVRDRIDNNPSLQTEISAFIGQEAMHSKAHGEFNQHWRRDDYNIDGVVAWLNREDDRLKKIPARYQLAITCAAEHFTALLGEYILSHPELVQSFDPESAKLWLWHALEESEHKSVAFDVYQAVFADLKVRRQVMLSFTPSFLALVGSSMLKLLWQDRKNSLPRWRGNLRGVLMLSKMLINLIPEYLEYFNADFHPNQRDRSALQQQWRQRLSDGRLQASA